MLTRTITPNLNRTPVHRLLQPNTTVPSIGARLLTTTNRRQFPGKAGDQKPGSGSKNPLPGDNNPAPIGNHDPLGGRTSGTNNVPGINVSRTNRDPPGPGGTGHGVTGKQPVVKGGKKN